MEAPGQVARVDKVVIECKVLRGSLERTVAEGLEQTAAYMDRCAAEEGHLVVVDRTEGRRWAEVGREGVPPPDDVAGWRRHRRVGHVTTCFRESV